MIGHKTGAFRFVNQSRLSHSINVRFIGSKKALSSRLALVYLNMDIPRILKKCGHFNRTCPACLRVILLLFFLSLKIISQFQRLPPSHAPAYYIVSFAHIFFLDFSGEFSLGDHFNRFVVRTFQGVAGARLGVHIRSRLNSILGCVLYLNNQSRPPPYRVEAPPAPHL